VIEMSRRPPRMNERRLVALGLGRHEAGVGGVVLDQSILKRAQTKDQFSSSISMSGRRGSDSCRSMLVSIV